MKKREFVIKVYLELKRRIRFFNISNSNVRGLADREYCYKKLKRKYKKILDNEQNNYVSQEKYEYSNKVWICWFQGLESAPDLVKRCVCSVKKYLPDKEVIIITADNYAEYVDIPEYILKKFNKGIISYAHFSDILRIELLTKFGGLWIDSTVYMTQKQNIIDYETPLFVFKNISLNRKEGLAIVASNWLIYSCKENCILNLTKKLLYEYWKKNNMAVNYNIFHIFFTLATEVYNKEWDNVPTYSNIPPHILQFELLNKYEKKRFEEIKKMSCFHKLNRRIKSDEKNTFYDYIISGVNYEKI